MSELEIRTERPGDGDAIDRVLRAAFDAAFQLLELEPGALDGCRGWVRYHDAFSEL